MRRALRSRLSDEHGFSMVFVGLGFMAFLAASMLAIDVGMLMTARNQAQNSADAGALAGATALVFDSWTDRSATGPAVQNALIASTDNQVVAQNVSVTPADVTFPTDANGVADRVGVQVFRTAKRGNPVATLIAQYFGIKTADIGATAVAEASAANAENCVLPFTIPDKWTENSSGTGAADGPWSPASTYDIYYSKGSNQNGGAPLPNPDVYVGASSSGYTGYNPGVDTGLELVLKADNTNKVSPSLYNPWDLPGSVGGSDYRNNIANCNTDIISIGDFMTPETGNMSGPTKQGTDDLVAKDPNAYWDTTCNCVKGSAYAVSPRIGVVPLYDPQVYATGQQSGKSQPALQVVNYLGFFIEGDDASGDVTGRIVPITGLLNKNLGAPEGAFPRFIRLVQ